jgi:HEPN domain-containing protein
MPREDARTHLARQWLRKASRDMRAAELALGAQDELWEIATFHSQQVAEKALKGFLAWHNVPFRRTHNLVELVEQCEAIDAAFAALREPAQFLTRFAVDPRYPGAAREPDQQTAEDALQRAREVMRFVLAHLPQEVHP